MENDLKPQPERNAHFRSVVKLFCSTLLFSSRPLTWSTVATACANFALPWQVKAQKSCNGSGFMIQHDQLTRCVVTNAHVVENANSILVRRHGTARRFTAKVLCLGYQCDLALLTVDDEAFWRDAPLLQLSSGDFPHLQQSVIAVGYPTGGDAISVTSGVVSRIGVRNYVGRFWALVSVQVDCGINPGNSGGPVFTNDGKVVGVAFACLTNAQNIGYIIPTSVLTHFLDDFRLHGNVSLVDLGASFQHMENDALRSFARMKTDETGVMVSMVQPDSCSAAVLRRGDVVLAVDGQTIANDGTIPLREDERIDWRTLVDQKHRGDNIIFNVLRDGQRFECTIVVQPPTPLVPILANFDAFPTYIIVGGIVFQELSVPFLHALYGSSFLAKAPVRLVENYLYKQREFPEQRIVILSQILASPTTMGYGSEYKSNVLHQFNNVNVRNLRHLASLVDSSIESDVEFFQFILGESKHMLVLMRNDIVTSGPLILKQHAIASDRSTEL